MYLFSLKTLQVCIISSLLSLQACNNKTVSSSSEAQPATPINKESNKKKDTYPVQEYTHANELGTYAQAVFAGGCFWCTEAVFQRINGVKDVISGYSGGQKAYPSYKGVGTGKTGHAEAIYIYYDPEVITFERLLDIFFVAHDPTTLNRQGPDVGTAYRSGIYFQSAEQQSLINKSILALNASGKLPGKIVTEVKPYEEFWVAEEYHQNFYELNPNQGYVARISRPKVEKVLKTFPEEIKKEYTK